MITPTSKKDAELINGLVFSWSNETSIFQSAKKQGGFDRSWMIALPGTAERVRLDYKYEGHEASRCRLELNPSKLGAPGLADLDHVMPFPNGWSYVIEHGRITRIDIAVDFPGLQMQQFLFMPHQGLTTKTWSQNGQLETLQLGKQRAIKRSSTARTRSFCPRARRIAGRQSSGSNVGCVTRRRSC